MESNLSNERKEYIKNTQRRKRAITLTRIGIFLITVTAWEAFARIGIIDGFVMSMPSRILKTVVSAASNGLFLHIGVTLYETMIGFVLGVVFGGIIAAALWSSEFLSKAVEPYLVALNSLPKIALGPVIIIWVGAGTKAIIVMALAISMIVTTLEMLNGFRCTEAEKIMMAKTFGARKWEIFLKIVLPSNVFTLFNSLKINIGLSLVGVIAGEFLVSKAGLGYLIVYGGQVFKMDLVMASVIILSVVAMLIYKGITFFEKLVLNNIGKAQ